MDSPKEAEDAEAKFRALLDAANQIPIPEPEPEEPAAEYPDAREPNGRRIIVIGELPIVVSTAIERRGYFVTRRRLHRAMWVGPQDDAWGNPARIAVEAVHDYDPALVLLFDHPEVLPALEDDPWIMRRPVLVVSKADLGYPDPDVLLELLDKIDELCADDPVAAA